MPTPPLTFLVLNERYGKIRLFYSDANASNLPKRHFTVYLLYINPWLISHFLLNGTLFKGISPMAYHGGALNGKDCIKILEHAASCTSLEAFSITECLVKDDPEKANKFWVLFKILQKCYSKLRLPCNDDNEILDTIEACESWCKQLPLLFPSRNITRKGHTLSIHVPQYLQEFKNLYHQFFKLEQRGESLHAKANKLNRERFFNVKPDELRLLKTIIELEKFNRIDREIFKPRT